MPEPARCTLANRLEALTRRLETAAVISRALVEAASADSQTDAALVDLFVPFAPQAIEATTRPWRSASSTTRSWMAG